MFLFVFNIVNMKNLSRKKDPSEKKRGKLKKNFQTGTNHLYGKYPVNIKLNGRAARILAIAVTAFMLLFVFHFRRLFLNDFHFYYGNVVYIFALLSAPLAGFLIAFKIWFNERFAMLFSSILFLLLPVATMQMVECYNGNFVYNFSVPTFLLNYVAYVSFYLICYLISGRFHMSVLIVNISLYVFGMLNYFVDLFRGTPFVPMDFLTIKTGLNVADSYDPSISWNLIMASILMFLIYLLNRKLPNVPVKKLRFKIMSKSLIAGFLLIIGLGLFMTDFLADRGYKPDFWNQSRGYHNTGTWFNFCLNLKYLHINAPEGYDASQTSSIVSSMLKEYGIDPDSNESINMLTGRKEDTSAGKKQPNIICIMNESLSDPGTLGDLQTNEDYMPFIHGLKKNTIKGTLQMPVFGAGTSNSEFEFLTGDSISFLPAGCNVYQSYIHHSIPSLVSSLGAQGYSKTAFHPYYEDGWNRVNVYNYMGFSHFISIEDFIDHDILKTYQQDNDAYEFENNLKKRYPGKNMLLRRFISDSYDFKMLEHMYQDRNKSRPFFLFNVTMQNHGGYAVSYDNFNENIYTTNLSENYPKANRYLSLVKYSDTAFKQLISYFKKVKEPTIICMFGDHQPSVEDAFYEELYGTSLDHLSKKQQQMQYTTPFVIWANYDIPEQTIDRLSANYLSTLVCQLAGVRLTPYQRYLTCLHEKLPVIDTVGYIDSRQKLYTWNEDSRYTDLIRKYQCLEYNHLIDTDHRNTSLYSVSGSGN